MANKHQSTPLEEWLMQFFTDYAACTVKPVALRLETWLPRFFTDYQACKTPLRACTAEREPKFFRLDATRLAQWFTALAQPLTDARKGAFHFDPWEVAGLGRDEVRNSSVLAWLLNPKGSHGLGDAAMRGLLQDLSQFDVRFPLECSRYCQVRVESNPDGNSCNRIDIEIDDEKFFVVIEVKIGAPEGVDQMKRYGEVSQQLAGTRPWALVFLTPSGVASKTGGLHAGRVVKMSWRQLAFSVKQSVKTSSPDTANRTGPARHMAEQAAHKFLKQMRTF
jgi:hypothetical protein